MRTSSLKDLLSNGQLWFGKRKSLTWVKRPAATNRSASFGIREIDSVLHDGGLSSGVVHQWSFDSEVTSQQKKTWYAPAFVVSSLVAGIVKGNTLPQKHLVVWVGPKVWPTPHLLEVVCAGVDKNQWSIEKQALFLDANNKDKILWSTIQLLRSPAVLAVIVDGTRMNLIATRRIQLAAQKSGAFCFLMRPPWEMEVSSCAQTKWCVRPSAGSEQMRWALELYSAKGLPAPVSWELEWQENEHDQTGTLGLVQAPAAAAAGDESTRAARKA